MDGWNPFALSQPQEHFSFPLTPSPEKEPGGGGTAEDEELGGTQSTASLVDFVADPRRSVFTSERRDEDIGGDRGSDDSDVEVVFEEKETTPEKEVGRRRVVEDDGEELLNLTDDEGEFKTKSMVSAVPDVGEEVKLPSVSDEEEEDLTGDEEEFIPPPIPRRILIHRDEWFGGGEEDEDRTTDGEEMVEVMDDEDGISSKPKPEPSSVKEEDWFGFYDDEEESGRDDESVSTITTVEPVEDDLEDSATPSKRPRVEYSSWDPENVKQEEFYGSVSRTVTKLAETIESMPTQDNYPEVVLPVGLIKLKPHQLYGLQWLSWREQEFPGGGILADEMGLGKTVMMIALIMKSKEARGEEESKTVTIKEGDKEAPVWRNIQTAKTTLVILPLGCLRQWETEIAEKGKGLSVAVYYGEGRATSAIELARKDVVLTTYDTVVLEVPLLNEDTTKKRKRKKNERSPLLALYWRRIILDEAHIIRNWKTQKAQAICRLAARHRWAVTGTPIHNCPGDLFSIVKFLRMTPFDDHKEWDFWIGLKNVRHEQQKKRLHTIGKALILRRTKEEIKAKIPPKTVEEVTVTLSEGEKQIYDRVHSLAQQRFKDFLKDKEEREKEEMYLTAEERKELRRQKKIARLKAGEEDTVTFSNLLVLFIRLRQCAVLPHLIQTMLEDDDIGEDVPFDELNDEHIVSMKNPVFDRLFPSAKFRRIIEDLEELKRQAEAESKPMDKVVIVSCWTTTLDILQHHLREKGFTAVFITGKENLDERAEAQRRFNGKMKKPEVLLLSLCAGGVGLNLVGGNYVFFVEPHWNPQLELQAQDRVHRYGQKKNVTIRRYISTDTVEERVLALQNAKIELADGLLTNTKKKAGAGISLSQMRLLFDVQTSSTN